MNKMIVICLLSCYALANNSCEQNPNEIIKKIIQINPNLKMINEKINGTEEQINTSYFNFFPSISIDVNSRDSERNNFLGRIEQPIWTGGKLSNDYDYSKSIKKEAEFEFEENSYNLTENIFNLLFDLNDSKEKIKELENYLNELLFFEKMINKRIDAGISPLSDLYLLTSRLENIKSNIILEKNKYKTTKMKLELLVEEKIDCEIILKNNIKINQEKPTFEENPMIQKVNQEIRSNIVNYEKEKSKLYPTINLVLEHKQGDLYNKELENNSNNQSLVYLNLSTKLSLANSSEIEQKKIKIKELEYKKKNIEKKIEEEYITTYNEYSVLDEKIKILENTIISSNNVLESYKRLFLVGKRQWLDLANAIQEKSNYKIELSNTKIKKEILLYKLYLQQGQMNLKTGDIK